MKKVVAIILSLVVLSLTLTGCISKNPPKRISKEIMLYINGQPDKCDSLEEYIKGVDLYAIIEIQSWKSEDTDNFKTYYKAKVVKTLYNKTNEETKNITLVQSGCSKYTIDNYPLLTVGDKVLVGIVKGEDGAYHMDRDYYYSMLVKGENKITVAVPYSHIAIGLADYDFIKADEENKEAINLAKTLREEQYEKIKKDLGGEEYGFLLNTTIDVSKIEELIAEKIE